MVRPSLRVVASATARTVAGEPAGSSPLRRLECKSGAVARPGGAVVDGAVSGSRAESAVTISSPGLARRRTVCCGMAKKGRETSPELQQTLDAVGGVPGLAKLLQVSALRVARWRTIPAEYVIEIEAKAGLPRERVRPDRAVTRRGR